MDDILVEVKSQLPNHENKEFAVATAEQNTAAGLIRKVCKENGIPMKTSYTLRDSRGRVLQWSRTLTHSGVKHGDTLILTNEVDDYVVHNVCSWNSWWFVAAISLMIGGVGVTAITLLYTKNGQDQFQYGVVLDAGSSHTSLFVYRWNGNQLQKTALARQIHQCNVPGPGLTGYEDRSDQLGGPLSVCLEEAKNHIPPTSRAATPIFLGATAGMRMLNEVDPVKSEDILEQVRETIKRNTSFSFLNPTQQARIISGQEEGTFGWVTANYIAGRLGVTPIFHHDLSGESYEDSTIGALDMGGASTQITFYTPQSGSMPAGYGEELMLYGRNYSVYTHSYLCFGINEAIRQYMSILVKSQGYNESNIDSPCTPTGNVTVVTYSSVFEAPCTRYVPNLRSTLPPEGADVHEHGFNFQAANYSFIGTSNETECRKVVKKMFNFSAPCPDTPCSFNGTFQPPVHGEFYAFSSFFYEMDFLNYTKRKQDKTIVKFDEDLSKLCNSTWDEVKTMPAGNNGSMLGLYCFEGHYMRTLLIDAYKFDNNTWGNINFVKKINNTDIGWSLGYMLNSSTYIKPIGPRTYISTGAFSSLMALFAIFLLLSVGFGCYARRYQAQKARGLYEQVPTYGAV